MHVSVAEAQGQLLDLIRRAQAGEDLVLTHEGQEAVSLSPVQITRKPWADRTPAEPLEVILEVVAKAQPKPAYWPDAAQSHGLVNDKNGLPVRLLSKL